MLVPRNDRSNEFVGDRRIVERQRRWKQSISGYPMRLRRDELESEASARHERAAEFAVCPAYPLPRCGNGEAAD
jgi:hypothetical protein